MGAIHSSQPRSHRPGWQQFNRGHSAVNCPGWGADICQYVALRAPGRCGPAGNLTLIALPCRVEVAGIAANGEFPSRLTAQTSGAGTAGTLSVETEKGRLSGMGRKLLAGLAHSSRRLALKAGDLPVRQCLRCKIPLWRARGWVIGASGWAILTALSPSVTPHSLRAGSGVLPSTQAGASPPVKSG